MPARLAAALLAAVLLASACGSTEASVGASVKAADDLAAEPVTDPAEEEGVVDGGDELAQPEKARTGAPAASERLRFRPTRLQLPDGSDAPVQPASTTDGELQVPEDVDRLGWWDGGAYVNDPFGSTVLAGHIDSAEQGVGFFGKLLTIPVGEEVVVQGDGGELAYEVTSTELVDKDVLVEDTVAFDQSGAHRLVLITCSGRWIPELHSYESNFVVIAEPVGLAQPRS